jgi:hypothetical protein
VDLYCYSKQAHMLIPAAYHWAHPAGVPYEALNNERGTSTSSAAMAAAAAAAPKPEGYQTYAQQEQEQRGSHPSTAAVDASAAETAGGGAVGAAAAAASQAGSNVPVTSASFDLPAGSKPSVGEYKAYIILRTACRIIQAC